MVTTGVDERQRRAENGGTHRLGSATVRVREPAAEDDRAQRASTERKEWTLTPDPTEAEAPVADATAAPWSSRVDDLIRAFAWAKMLGG